MKTVYSEKVLESKTTKELLQIAKDLSIVGRHDMKKPELIGAILSGSAVVKNESEQAVEEKVECNCVVESRKHKGFLQAQAVEEEWEEDCSNRYPIRIRNSNPKPKTEYIDNAKVGTIIAFKVNESGKAFSGKIEEIHKNGFLVVTKNGVRFKVFKHNVIWVKTSQTWPRGVFMALKGDFSNERSKAATGAS